MAGFEWFEFIKLTEILVEDMLKMSVSRMQALISWQKLPKKKKKKALH